MKFATIEVEDPTAFLPHNKGGITVQLRWAVPMALWTMLSGPVLARPRPPVSDHAKQMTMKSESTKIRTTSNK
jgi:hypothetical protein